VSVQTLGVVGVEGTDGLALLSAKEVARILGVSDEAVRRLVRDGRLPAYRLGGGPKARVRIESAAVASYLRATRATVEAR
jgi:excisionase family DNA binding protein